MPNVTRTVRSGDQDIDGLLDPYRWATHSLTFSFPTSIAQWSDGYGPGEEPYDNFETLNATQRAAVIDILGQYSAVANLSFTQTSGGTGDLRFGMSDMPETAHAYTPTSAPWGGDSWYNNSGGEYDDPVRGNYAWTTFLHEIGHALGLKHPHDTENFGAMSSAHDWMAYTVMSYRSVQSASVGEDGGYTNETWGYAQTLMTYDIAALQHMYGANFSTNSADTTYRWSPTTGEMFIDGAGQGTPGENRIFMSVWDGGGTDTYDFSNYPAGGSGLQVDLGPGRWTFTSVVQLANLGPDTPPANIANALLYRGDTRSLIENAIGGAGDDSIFGNQAANRLQGGDGRDELWGLEGADLLDGSAAADHLMGGLGDDTYIVDHSGDMVDEMTMPSGGIDLVLSSVDFRLFDQVENLTLTGSANLTGYGNSLSNRIIGNDGANLIDGGARADDMRGGRGNDTYIVDDAGDRVTELVSSGVDLVRSSVSFRLGANVENLVLVDTARIGIGNGLANRITGNAAANSLNGGPGADVTAGGLGDDVYYVDDVGDRVSEGVSAGVDWVKSAISFRLGANFEKLSLVGTQAINGTGNGLDNVIAGNGAANILNGAAGKDLMFGGKGNDIYYVDNAGDRAIERADGGADLVRSSATSRLRAHVENLALTGSANIAGYGNDAGNALTGNAGYNLLSAGDGADRLNGGDGNDRLFGGAGSDRLTGGLDGDRFYFDTALDASLNVDAVLDFSTTDDRIMLDRSIFSGIGADGVLSASAFHAGGAAAGADDRILYDQATGQIFYDADGAGGAAAILFATVARGTELTHQDFSVYP